MINVNINKKLLDKAMNSPKLKWWRKTNKKKVGHKLLDKVIKDKIK